MKTFTAMSYWVKEAFNSTHTCNDSGNKYNIPLTEYIKATQVHKMQKFKQSKYKLITYKYLSIIFTDKYVQDQHKQVPAGYKEYVQTTKYSLTLTPLNL